MTVRLLLVEDEEHLAYVLRFNLEAEGYDVDVAGTLAEARRLLAARPDLVVLDVMLPDGSGFDLCTAMRAGGDRTPVLMLTAKGSPDDVVQGLDAGADDYVSKPFALREVLSRIVALLRRRQWERGAEPDRAAAERAAGRFGSSSVDFETHKVVAQGTPVDVTDLEFRLLRFFLENEGRVVPREELLERVWGVARHANTRTVDNFMTRLRRLFEADPSVPEHFLTVRGAGYRFVREP